MDNGNIIERVLYLRDILSDGNLDEELLSSISNELLELSEQLKSLY